MQFLYEFRLEKGARTSKLFDSLYNAICCAIRGGRLGYADQQSIACAQTKEILLDDAEILNLTYRKI